MPTRGSPLLGKWRIVEMELWDTDFVDMLEPAYITFEAKGGGEYLFGAVQGDLDCRYGPDGRLAAVPGPGCRVEPSRCRALVTTDFGTEFSLWQP